MSTTQAAPLSPVREETGQNTAYVRQTHNAPSSQRPPASFSSSQQAEEQVWSQSAERETETPATDSQRSPGSETTTSSVVNGNVKRMSLSALPSPTESGPSVPASPAPRNDLRFRRLSTDSQLRLISKQDGLTDGNPPMSPVSPAAIQTPRVREDESRRVRNLTIDTSGLKSQETRNRPSNLQRAQSSPAPPRPAASARRPSDKERSNAVNADNDRSRLRILTPFGQPLPSPIPKSIPLPPVSLPTYLALELSSQRPSRTYIHRSASSDFPYESSRVKIERLLNFLYLPFHLEAVLWFGMLACLDSWLYTFTILPLRLLKSFYILAQSWIVNSAKEVNFVFAFVYSGTFRWWRRRGAMSNAKTSSTETALKVSDGDAGTYAHYKRARHHRRTKSVPSNLMPDDKADILKGLLIACTCVVLLRLDASRMYHWVRGQAVIKLYVIYNVLEVCDRLLSALGQDVLECLFSRETLERKPDGHSKVLRPFWLFILALAYTTIHSTALFYQVITLNVAVNAYSNALFTLLLSNQFVEIKSTVFKKFEKENLFQLTCADVVERFQLWHMLIIIAARNIAETGNIMFPSISTIPAPRKASLVQAFGTNITATSGLSPPQTMSSILPLSFTFLPDFVASITSYVPHVSHVLGPFVIVLGSEMFVDWLKHAYINKFNNTRPAIYDRFLDVLAKDYYTNAFGDQNLTKRLGLPVIPLSCLLIRASVQTCQTFLASWSSGDPSSTSASPSLASIHEAYTSSLGPTPTSPAGAIVQKLDSLLGGYPSFLANSDAVTTYVNAFLITIVIFLVALAAKLVLGMILLAFARNRYRSMKEREKEPIYHVEGGRRVGGWGVVEVDEDKRRWIYDEDPDGLRALQEREARDRDKRARDKEKGVTVDSFENVKRYEMTSKGKRIF